MKSVVVNESEDSTLIITRKYAPTKYSPDPALDQPGYEKGDRLVEGAYTSKESNWEPSSWSRAFLVSQETYDALKIGDKINFRMDTTVITTHTIFFI